MYVYIYIYIYILLKVFRVFPPIHPSLRPTHESCALANLGLLAFLPFPFPFPLSSLTLLYLGSCALAKLGLAKWMAATPSSGEGAALLMDAEGLLRKVLA